MFFLITIIVKLKKCLDNPEMQGKWQLISLALKKRKNIKTIEKHSLTIRKLIKLILPILSNIFYIFPNPNS